MLKKRSSPFARVDWLVILLYLLLLAYGWVSICGATHEIGDTNFFEWGQRSGMQLVWMGCALVLGFVVLMIDDQYYDQLAGHLYFLMMCLLLLTPFLAKDIKGSRSWIDCGICNVQPAEFAKCATALALAKLCNGYGFVLNRKNNFVKALGLVLLPMALIILQRETGSALVFLAFFLVFYREGMPGCILFVAVAAVVYFVVGIRFADLLLPGTKTSVGEFVTLTLVWLFTLSMMQVYGKEKRHLRFVLLLGVGTIGASLAFSSYVWAFDLAWVLIGLLGVVMIFLSWHAFFSRMPNYLLIAVFTAGSMAFLYLSDFALHKVLEPHQRTRIEVLLGMVEDVHDAGYNVNQSKIAIGSGGLSGKGFMNGTQTKLKYVPEQDTDFIFCTVGEEQGFVGSALVLGLFLVLILRLIFLAERQSSVFGRVYGYSVLSLLLFHVFINIGMVMGLTPVIGIPLPFFSYGGSSLWGFTLLLFIFLRIDAGRKG